MLSTPTGCGAVWSAGRGWRSNCTRWRRTTPRLQGKDHPDILTAEHQTLSRWKFRTLIFSLICLLKEQQSCGVPWKPWLPTETYFPTSCHPPQNSTSSPWDSNLRPRHRKADPQGPSGVKAIPIYPDIRRVSVALWSTRAVWSQVTTELEQWNIRINYWSSKTKHLVISAIMILFGLLLHTQSR